MNQKQPKKSGVLLWVLIGFVAVCILAVILWPERTDAPVQPSRESTIPTVRTEPATGSDETEPLETEPLETEPAGTDPGQTVPEDVSPVPTTPAQKDPAGTEPPQEDLPAQPQQHTINLGYGLELTDAGGYTGAYVEDGSGEIVSDVMMIVVCNTGEQDIQLADITALSGGVEYTFRLTNLAAGERMVLLDLKRMKAAEGVVESAIMSDVVLFETPMELHEQTIQISGLNGMLNVKNISDHDIEGEIFIYYKFAAPDLFYGGITFRVRVEGGLKAGELRQVPAGHFVPDNCRIVQVTIHA